MTLYSIRNADGDLTAPWPCRVVPEGHRSDENQVVECADHSGPRLWVPKSACFATQSAAETAYLAALEIEIVKLFEEKLKAQHRRRQALTK